MKKEAKMKELTTEQAMRYNRQILIPGFDLDKQETLLNARILIVGAGGLGCSVAQFLCAAGIGYMTILDDDKVEKSNLPRQILHFENDVGINKVDSVKSKLAQINSDVVVDVLAAKAQESNLPTLLTSHHLVVDCSDNLHTRNLLNQLCYNAKISLVSGAAIRMEGQIFCVSPLQNSACYQCISQFFGEQHLSCVESGIMSPVVGVIGAYQALEAIKLLTKFGEPSINKLQLFDGMNATWQSFKVSKNKSCEVCGTG